MTEKRVYIPETLINVEEDKRSSYQVDNDGLHVYSDAGAVTFDREETRKLRDALNDYLGESD